MSELETILLLVTLGVSDLKRSIAFYEALGFCCDVRDADGVAFFQAGAISFAV